MLEGEGNPEMLLHRVTLQETVRKLDLPPYDNKMLLQFTGLTPVRAST
jgi:hypothetical protein